MTGETGITGDARPPFRFNMPPFVTFAREWFSNPRADILAGIVVALALIPEAIGFSIIAGVDPRVGLYASFSIAVVIALVGGRPGMNRRRWRHFRVPARR